MGTASYGTTESINVYEHFSELFALLLPVAPPPIVLSKTTKHVRFMMDNTTALAISTVLKMANSSLRY